MSNYAEMNTCVPVERTPNMTSKVKEIADILTEITTTQMRINKHFFGSVDLDQCGNKREVNCFAVALDDIFDNLVDIKEMQQQFMKFSGVE